MPPEGGGDTHYSLMRGSNAELIIKQGAEQGFKPVLGNPGLACASLDNKEAFGGQFPETVPDEGGVQDGGIVPGCSGELLKMGEHAAVVRYHFVVFCFLIPIIREIITGKPSFLGRLSEGWPCGRGRG